MHANTTIALRTQFCTAKADFGDALRPFLWGMASPRIKGDRVRSLKTEVDRQEKRLGGLTHVRLILIVVIIALQSIEVSGGPTRLGPIAIWPIQMAAISGLFALQAYVIGGSRSRHTLKRFMLLRLRSAYPAFAAIIVLSFAALGPVFADNGAASYFRDGRSWLYLLNLLGIPIFDLPGVFEFNLVRLTVNMVVALAPAFIILTALTAAMPRLGKWFPIVCVTLVLALPVSLTALQLGELLSLDRGSGIHAAVFDSGLAALCGGLIGSLALHWGGRFPVDRRIQAGAAVMFVLLCFVAARAEIRNLPFVILMMAAPAAYLALTLAIRHRRVVVPQLLTGALHPAFVSSFPIQQIVTSVGSSDSNSVINFVLSFAASATFGLAFAYLTDRFLPKPEGYRTKDVSSGSANALPTLAALRRQAVSIASGAAVGMIFAAIVVAVMALTFYAIQRPPEGI